MIEPNWSYSDYLEKVKHNIRRILSRPKHEQISFDLLDTEISMNIKLTVLKEKQRQMKIGEIWQSVIGEFDGFEDLKVGHETGLDVISHSRKIVIELKNRTNTDNASSRLTNFNKLAIFKQANPEYTCIYANINAETEEKTLTGIQKIFVHNNVEIVQMVGMTFLKHVFGDYTNEIISTIKSELDAFYVSDTNTL